jgi:hypothetical protein
MEMVNAPSSTPLPLPSGLTRSLCFVVLLLMGVALVYGVVIAARNIGRIGV